MKRGVPNEQCEERWVPRGGKGEQPSQIFYSALVPAFNECQVLIQLLFDVITVSTFSPD